MEKIILNIEANGMNGEGIARLNNKVYFVDGAVSGDIVEAIITKENKNFVNTKIHKIKQKSQIRCVPQCKYYGQCGGCNLQHIEYFNGLKIKTENIKNLFNKQKIDVTVNNCISSNLIYGYRNKITLYLSKNKNLGFFEKKSNNIVEINECKLVDFDFNNLLIKLNAFFKLNLEYSSCLIKGLAIRKAQNNIFVLNFILTKKINFFKLENYLKLNKIKYAIYYCINNQKNNNLPKSPCFFVGGVKDVFNIENGIKYPIHPMSFLQINNTIKEQIYGNVCSLINKDSIVLDAYSGAGLLSAMIAENAKKVFAVEIEKEASLACEQLCKINKIKNLDTICGDCKEIVPIILQNNKLDVVIFDPARKGVDEGTLNAVKKARPAQIIYLSCNPATLARDVKTLYDNGYEIDLVQPYDMFPQTSEIETLVVLKPSK